MLNDDDIKTQAEVNSLISPFDLDQLQPHSYDAKLGSDFKLAHYLPCGGQDARKWVGRSLGEYELKKHEFALGTTIEYFKLPQDIVGFVQGKSTVGRNGLQIECAGLIDAGFEGTITLELFNMAPWPIKLVYGQKICQIHFAFVDSPVHKDYTKIGSYNGQTGATEPKYNI